MTKLLPPLNSLRFLPIIATALLGGICPALAQGSDGAPDPILVALQAELERELADLRPAARFEIPEGQGGRSLIMRYRIRDYMIYPNTKAGRLGRELVEQEGPDDDGILLRVHIQPKGELNQAVVPQTIRRPYWQTYLNVYPVADSDQQLYIALSFRGWTDKKLIGKIQSIAAGLSGAGGDQPAASPVQASERER